MNSVWSGVRSCPSSTISASQSTPSATAVAACRRRFSHHSSLCGLFSSLIGTPSRRAHQSSSVETSNPAPSRRASARAGARVNVATRTRRPADASSRAAATARIDLPVPAPPRTTTRGFSSSASRTQACSSVRRTRASSSAAVAAAKPSVGAHVSPQRPCSRGIQAVADPFLTRSAISRRRSAK